MSFRPRGVEENKVPVRPEAEGGGEGLEGDDGGLATRPWGEGGDIAPARTGVRDRSLVA